MKIHRLFHQAFTLIELLLVVAILAILFAVVAPKLTGSTGKAKDAQAKAQIGNFSLALNAYEIDTGNYPRTLQSLVEEPGDVTGWSGPYLEKNVPLDPWGNAYIYEYPGKRALSGFDLSSPGPDGRPGTDDDITNWDDR